MADQSLSPIFVVGTSRAGTTLMQRILTGHPELAIAPETHYFDDLRDKVEDPAAPLPEGEVRKRVEDYFLRLGDRPYGYGGDPDKGRIPRAELQELAAARGGSADAHFEAFCEIFARHRDGTRWGEKTPRHIFRIPALLSAYPDARVLVLVRDPRAVVASYRDWRSKDKDEGANAEDEEIQKEFGRQRASYHVILQSYLWRSTLRAGLLARRRFGDERVLVKRYEDVVGDPRATIGDIAAFVGVEFDERMLDIPILNSTYGGKVEKGGFSKEAAERWRKRMSPGEIRVVQSCCRAEMAEVGYEPLGVRWAPLGALWAWLTLPVAFVRAATANRGRIHSLPTYVWNRLKLAFSR
jgi:hypothetical protein